MKDLSLFQLLLAACDEPGETVAEALQISPSSLSRHSRGLLKKRGVLQRAAKYLSERVGGKIACDSDLLQLTLSPRALVFLADYLRTNHLLRKDLQDA